MAVKEKKTDDDPRINILGRAIEDDFATIRENYGNFAGQVPR
jgi:triacylglycerol lipase